MTIQPYTKLTCFGIFSNGPVEKRIIGGVNPDLMEKWAYIDKGELPPGDDNYNITEANKEKIIQDQKQEMRHEIQQECNRYFGGEIFEIDDWDLD